MMVSCSKRDVVQYVCQVCYKAVDVIAVAGMMIEVAVITGSDGSSRLSCNITNSNIIRSV